MAYDNRPYLNEWASDLRRLARENAHSREILEDIEHELANHRSTWFAGLVLDEVREYLAALNGTATIFFPSEAPLEIPFLLPDDSAGECWMTQKDLAAIEERFASFHHSFDVDALADYAYDCRLEIRTKRRYQIPSQGNAELRTSDRLLELLDLRAIRFVQEGVEPPAVYQRFEFGSPPTVGIIRVNAGMSVEGFYEFCQDNQLRTVIQAIALGYFRDLVVPVVQSPSPRKRRRRRRSRKNTSRKRTGNGRSLPRTPDYVPDRIEKWHQIQEKEEQTVVGHMRWISRDFIADDERQQLCRDAIGKPLPQGYTWVREHERGSSDPGVFEVRRSDLTRRIRFLPPRRASAELDQLLQ